MDISTLSIVELEALLKIIPKEIETRKKNERAHALKALEALAAERGFSLEELVGAAPTKKARAAVAIKYRHPSLPDLTWTGRGRQPKWVVDFLQSGSIDQLKV